MSAEDQLPDSASFWNDVRKHFSRPRYFKPTPAEILLNNEVIHRTNSVAQARTWVKKKVKAEIPNPPGSSDSWLLRALRAGYVVRRQKDNSTVTLTLD